MNSNTTLTFLMPRRGLSLFLMGAILLGSVAPISLLAAGAVTRTNTLLPGTRFATASSMRRMPAGVPTPMVSPSETS